jgi:hypothetical protein
MRSSTVLHLDRELREQMMPLLLLITAVAAALILRWMLVDYVRLAIVSPSPESASEYRACILWASSFIAFVVIASWVIIITAEWLSANYPKVRPLMWPAVAIIAGTGLKFNSAILLTLIAMVVVAAPLAIVSSQALAARYPSAQRRIHLAAPIFAVIFLLVLLLLPRTDSQQPSLLAWLDNAGVPVFSITAFGNTAAVLTIAFIIAASIGLIKAIQHANDANGLRSLLDAARLQLYSAAVFLVVGVIEIYLLWDWPSHLTSLSPSASAAIHQMAQSVVTMCGSLYSLMLLSIFIPVLLIHEQYTRKLVPVNGPSQPGASAASSLNKSALSLLPELLAIVSPILTALGIPKLLTGA